MFHKTSSCKSIASNGSKFRKQTQCDSYLKLICLLLIIVSPFVLVQFIRLTAQSSAEQSYAAPLQDLPHRDGLGESRASQDFADQNRAASNEQVDRRHIYLAPVIESRSFNDEGGASGRVGELFDVHYESLGDELIEPTHRAKRDSQESVSSSIRNELPEETSSKAIVDFAPESSPPSSSISPQGEEANEVTATAASEHNEAKPGGYNNPPVQNESGPSLVERNSSQPEQVSGRQIVLVASKSGRFNSELMPLDDLIVAPANEVQEMLGDANHQLVVVAGGGDAQGEPTSSELSTAGTMAGMMIGDLVAKASQAEGGDETAIGEENGESGEPQMVLSAGDQARASGERDLATLQTLDGAGDHRANHHANQVQPIDFGANQQQAGELAERADQQEFAGVEKTPESLESLIGAEQTGEDEPNEATAEGTPESNSSDDSSSSSTNSANNDQAKAELASSPNPLINPIPVRGVIDEHEDDGDERENESSDRQDIGQVPAMDEQQLYQVFPINRSPVGSAANRQLVASGGNPPQDLNTAAGHYYGKKKKKKKIKKIVIKKKKKKKVKKYKKVKIVKYKKKKIVKKKKKKHYKKHKMGHHDHGKYYMYAKVPKKKSWEFGFKKGNKKHWIERHEKGHKNKFKTKVKWYDKKSKGKGYHIWDYNHHDKKKKHYG